MFEIINPDHYDLNKKYHWYADLTFTDDYTWPEELKDFWKTPWEMECYLWGCIEDGYIRINDWGLWDDLIPG